MREISSKTLRLRRSAALISLILVLISGYFIAPAFQEKDSDQISTQEVLSDRSESGENALIVLEQIEVKGRAPKTGYKRSEFGDGWAVVKGCDMRNRMLKNDMTEVRLAEGSCIVLNGTLDDPYTGNTIFFTRGANTSDDVQVDHVVALSDAWQKGAQNLSFDTRIIFANDPLNLLAVDGPTNQKKGDADAASWLPPNKHFRCRYIARQIAVKKKYSLWITEAEKSAMKRVLNGCRNQELPVVS